MLCPIFLMAPPIDTRLLISRERRSCSLQVDRITAVLDSGLTSRRRSIEAAVRSDPTGVFDNTNNASLTRPELYSRALAKHIRVMELARKLRVKTDDVTSPEFVMLLQAIGDDLPSLLHFGMFVPNVKCLFDDEQCRHWLPLCEDCRVVGCYAQTELGHGR